MSGYAIFGTAGGGGLEVVSVDPASPKIGQTWLLETVDNAANTIQAFVGGIPLTTQVTDYSYRFSVYTQEGIKRVLMT